MVKRIAIKALKLCCLVGTASLFYATLKQHLKRRKYRHIPGPITKGVLDFFLGNYSEFSDPFPDNLLHWSKEYGDVFKFQFIGEIIVVVSNVEAIKEIATEKDFPKNHVVYKLASNLYNERFLGNGLVSETDNTKWRAKRAILNHGFNRQFLIKSLNEFNLKADILIQNLLTKADNGKTVISLFERLNKTALDVIANVAFGIYTDSINDSKNKLNSIISTILEGLNVRFKDPLIILKPNKFNQVKIYQKAIRDLREFAKETILKRFQDVENGECIPNDMLTLIIKCSKGESLDIESLIDDFITLFIGGQETVSNTLAFCFLELGQNQEALEKLQAEVSQVLGSKTEITYEDLIKLTYTTAVFKETLRKWPLVSELYRISTTEIKINDLVLPQNTWIMLSPYVVQRSEINYPTPEKFIPERFLKDSEFSKLNNISSHTYFPFSVGPRNCIGRNFAKIECQILIAKLVQHFNVKLDPTQSFKATEMTTLRPVDGCRVYLTARN